MKANFIRVQKRFKRGRRSRTPLNKRFLGQKGQEWIDINMENTFTDVDNVASNWLELLDGALFDAPTNLSGVNNTIRIPRFFGMVRGFGVFNTEFSPYVDYDVAVVLASRAHPSTSPTRLSALVGNPGPLEGPKFRVLQHKRVTVANQAILLPTDGTTEYEAVVPSSIEDRWNFDVDNGVVLSNELSIYCVVSQCASELYTNEMASLFQGYLRAFAQEK